MFHWLTKEKDEHCGGLTPLKSEPWLEKIQPLSQQISLKLFFIDSYDLVHMRCLSAYSVYRSLNLALVTTLTD